MRSRQGGSTDVPADALSIADLLASLGASPRAAPLRALTLQPRTPGGSRPWDCLADDGRWYVVKCANNPQDRRVAPPLKFLPTELICARLGRLFDPPLSAEPALVDVPPALAAASLHPRTRRHAAERPAPGPAFGSRRIEGAVEIKADGGARLASLPLGAVARIIVFHTWLRGIDVSALVTAGGEIYSIDHGYFLGGHRWDAARLAAPGPVRLKVPSQLPRPERLADPAPLRAALDEVLAIPAARVVAAFAAVPPEWGVPGEVLTQAAEWVLDRRRLIEPAIAAAAKRFRHGARIRGRPALLGPE